jgi:hypothetical protein
MATNESLAEEIPAGTGVNGHPEELSDVVLGKHRIFAGGSRNLPITSSKDQLADCSQPFNNQKL